MTGKTTINFKIAALYGTIASCVLGTGAFTSLMIIEDNKNLSQVWEEINYLRPATDALEQSAILPERAGNIMPMMFPWTANVYINWAENEPGNIKYACDALGEMQDMNRHYLENLAEKHPEVLAAIPGDKSEYRRTVTETSPAEKALCLRP